MAKYERHDIRKAMQQEPWIKEIAAKPIVDLTNTDCQKVLLLFFCRHWKKKPWEVTSEDIGDVLLTIQTMI